MKYMSILIFILICNLQSLTFTVSAQEVALTEEYMLGSWQIDVEAYEAELIRLSEENNIPLEEEQLEQILESAGQQIYDCQSGSILLISTEEQQIEGNWRVDIPQKKLFLRFNLDAAELPINIIQVEENKLHFQDDEMGMKTIWLRVLD